ncbi:hypothetical protein B597_006500 [Stutzerimonas stutzeri KOS6]|uniref:Uncharacterized protein n=1 Tax=Stutzerimonas stutzeri KOS6 TaxID=1218352 RepID=A0A061JV88_STUST|nr:hypothetical protein B597_006500 [Stutzerimonas stutzeri KOS6]
MGKAKRRLTGGQGARAGDRRPLCQPIGVTERSITFIVAMAFPLALD